MADEVVAEAAVAWELARAAHEKFGGDAIGDFVASWSAWVAPVVGAAIFMYWEAARREERLLVASALGARYRAYARRVGMFVPLSLQRSAASTSAADPS